MTSRERFEAWYEAISPHVVHRTKTEFDYLIWKAATADCRKIAAELNCPQVAGAIGGDE